MSNDAITIEIKKNDAVIQVQKMPRGGMVAHIRQTPGSAILTFTPAPDGGAPVCISAFFSCPFGVDDGIGGTSLQEWVNLTIREIANSPDVDS